MDLDLSMLSGIVIMGLYFAVLIAMFRKVFKSRFGKPKTARAEVVGKQTVEFFSKYAPGNKRVRYVVNFLADGKKKSFYVHEFSYNGYHKGERGTITYRGDRLIDFS